MLVGAFIAGQHYSRTAAAQSPATEANVEEVVDNPDPDPAFWTLVKSQCSWQGRLDRKAFLEWNVSTAWNREGILEALSTVRSLSDRAWYSSRKSWTMMTHEMLKFSTGLSVVFLTTIRPHNRAMLEGGH